MATKVLSPLRMERAEPASLGVSVVVATRNRDAHVVECVKTILANEGDFDLYVVDQSDSLSTERALAQIRDPRFQYIRTPTRGVTKSRNIGIEMSRGDVIAFTDDDCRVSPDWVRQMRRVFDSDPDVAVVCGRVKVPEELHGRGHTEGFEPQERVWRGRYPPIGRDWGITANMGVRRTALARIGLFDPLLGVGAPLRSGGEPDLIFRALRNGFTVINAKEVAVDHLGVRAPGLESRRLIRGYGAGTGAALFKHARLGDPAGISVYLRFLGKTLSTVWGNVVHGRRPTGAGYLCAFLSGSVASLRFRVDRERRQFVDRARQPVS
jgi:glycosyltransferase involved in cell wall biosynthesis